VRSSPYHPQGNGVVERLHRTLNAIITKTAEKKGNWASVVPMALYFIRSLPCESTGISPFMARQGWEPSTPIQLLYETWAERDLGEVDLEQWVLENSEHVENLRESSSLKLRESMEKRKKTWDSKAKTRVFAVGEEVLMRKPGLCQKLEDSWEGPFVVTKQNSPLSYGIDTGDRKIPSVHVSLLKAYERPEGIAKIGRATSVFDADRKDDDIIDRYAEVKVTGDELDDSQKGDVARIMEEYGDTLTKEPGLTDLAVFRIDTGESKPIYQRPYNTPAHFRDSINKEIDWLLEKDFIRPSESPWASPIVAVRKPDGTARLCVDFKRVNAITTNQPFYMPHVEEVLEGVGNSKYISKLDLSKGYYQVKMCEEDVSKTAFVCHRGRFEFTRMPFGVKNAPACFQELMQGLFASDSFCSPYMDDLVIFSDSWEDHVRHIQEVLGKLKCAGLTANPAKCRWGGKSIEFLGHQVGGGRMSLPSHRAEAFREYSKPVTKKGLRSFLGAIGFYRRYVRQLHGDTDPAHLKAGSFESRVGAGR